MDKQSLYYFDSSDEEDEVIRSKYTYENISSTLARIPPPLVASYIFTEVAQSMFEQQAVQESYIELKNNLSNSLKVPQSTIYKKTNKFLGNFLLIKNLTKNLTKNLKLGEALTKKIELEKEAESFLQNIVGPYLEASSSFLSTPEWFKKYASSEGEDMFKRKLLINCCTEVSADWLQMLKSAENVKKFTAEIIERYNNDDKIDIPEVFKYLQTQKKTSFTEAARKLSQLEQLQTEKRDFINEAIQKFNKDLLNFEVVKVIQHKEKEVNEEEEQVIIPTLKDVGEEEEQQPYQLTQHQEQQVIMYFEKDWLYENCSSFKPPGKQYINKNKLLLFVNLLT